uniref:Uncharacterized protein n=1 Tax=Anguilla anguilla TaxID=7936 RepID=A0A0E9REF8_ANGAN
MARVHSLQSAVQNTFSVMTNVAHECFLEVERYFVLVYYVQSLL